MPPSIPAPIARPKPQHAGYEPPYPGAYAVLYSSGTPELTTHDPTPLCCRKGVHPIAECREWGAPESAGGHRHE